ncbi:3'-5' exonuclease [Clostridium sp. AM58-1XD]|uniref:3'-5' exonuclease n=1 Tax=Clostridium sp. AM58-1XD TaxID=2292307 RepID=UPI000E5023D3|nr:3'-5' exonuclease [Clostridium sp. AM58-1XD]RGZ01264.1 3'-5' exonuclease [Clostridium sp. AM58-1XD]
MIESYVAIDLETTGLNPKQDRILEIGAVLVCNGHVTKEFSTLINPKREITDKIVDLTGISGEMVENAPGIDDVIDEVLSFCSDCPLLGHNILFDYSFLKRAAVNSGHLFEKNGVDTLKLSRKFMPQEEKKNLSAACEWFHVKTDRAHRALADAYAAHELYQAMKNMYSDQEPGAFSAGILQYHVKKEQPASKRQKDHLRDLLKYHKISVSLQIDDLTRNEISRITDKIISQYGRIIK